MVFRRLIVVLVAGLVLGAALVAVAWRSYVGFLATPLVLPEEGLTWRLEAGSSYTAMVADLSARGVTRASWHWRLLGRLDDRPGRLHAGLYELGPGLTPVALLEKLASGDVYLHAFTIVEGWSYRQLRGALAEAPGIEATLIDATDEMILQALEIEATSPEGWFLPETYRYEDGTSDVELLAMAHGAMKAALDEVWERRPEGLPYASAYEILVMASIVEKETGVPEERPEIAGVFVRRLQKGMRLQTDPTVIYGLGESFDGDLRRRDLRADTPWNTYTRHGLPPTPIALPGRAALDAAVTPTDGEALYFVSRGDGTHVFSATLEAHEQAVDEYQRRRR